MAGRTCSRSRIHCQVTVGVHRAQREEASKQEPGAASMLGMSAHHTNGTPEVHDRCDATTQTHMQAAFPADTSQPEPPRPRSNPSTQSRQHRPGLKANTRRKAKGTSQPQLTTIAWVVQVKQRKHQHVLHTGSRLQTQPAQPHPTAATSAISSHKVSKAASHS
jgi:hypothetical protein